MKENIEEVVERLEKSINDVWFSTTYSQEDEERDLQALLSDYKRVLKENEELLEIRISTGAHNRIIELEKENEELKHKYDKALGDLVKTEKENEEWQRAYQEEKDKQFALIQNTTNNTIKTANIAIKDLQEKLKEVITKQKVKDKIEELNHRIDKYREYTEKGIETDVEWVDNVADRQTLKILQDLLEEKGE